MAVITFDPELMEGLGFAPYDIRDWKRHLAMRPIYEEPVVAIRRSLQVVDRSIEELKRRNNFDAVYSAIEERRTCHQMLKRLESPLWRCKDALRILAQKLDNGIPVYAQSSCRKLTTRLALLPRELRDMVYMHLLDEKVLGWIYLQVACEIRGHYRYCSHRKPSHWHFRSTKNVHPRIILEICQCAADIIARTYPAYSISRKDFDKFATGQSLHFGFPLSACSRDIKLELYPRDVIHHGFRRYQIKEDDWEAFQPYLRKLMVDVTDPVERKGDVVVIEALGVERYQILRFDFDGARYLAIFNEIARELRSMNFERVEVFLDDRRSGDRKGFEKMWTVIQHRT